MTGDEQRFEALPWLYVVARNQIANEHRAARRAAPFDPGADSRDPTDRAPDR